MPTVNHVEIFRVMCIATTTNKAKRKRARAEHGSNNVQNMKSAHQVSQQPYLQFN